MKQVWIGDFKIDWQRGEISIDNTSVSVEPRVLDVLQVLVEAQGEVVSQQRILALVWGDTIVAPNALQRCIAQLRKVLADDAKRQKVISTHSKRGYSLVATVSQQQPLEIRTIKPKGSLALLLLILLAVSVLSAIWLLNNQQLESVQYNQIIPITTTDQVERQPALSPDQKLLAFIRSNQSHDQIVIKDMASEQLRIVIEQGRFKGSVAFSPDANSLAYAETVFHQGVKCSRLMAVSLKSLRKRVLQACDDDFLTSPIWLDPQQLLFLQTSKAGIRQLKLLELSSGLSHRINNLPGLIVGLDYQRANEKLVLVTRGNDQQLRMSIATLDLPKFETVIEQNWPLKVQTNSLLQPQWFNENQVVLASDKSIYWFGDSGLEAITPVLSNDSIFSVLPYSNGELIAVMGTEDWDVRMRLLQAPDSATAAVDTTIARSTYGEYNAQFRPSTQGVSFVSFRSGSGQIWLSQGNELSQLSNSDSDITSYIWSSDGQQLGYVSDDGFWLKQLTGQLRYIDLNFKVKSIYQWYQDAQLQEHVLLSVYINDIPQIISLNLKTLDYITESIGENEWAQKVADNNLIVNDSKGRLFKQTAQGRVKISFFSDIVLHWRYYWRGNSLYFQDKAKNIWRYEPTDERAEVFARYDEQAIFMTDISPGRQSMLTENFVDQHKDIFAFKNSD